jgi:hypothetical protein
VGDVVAGHEVTRGSDTIQPGTINAGELGDALRAPSVASHLSGGLFSDSMICHPPDTVSVIRSGPTLYPCTAKDYSRTPKAEARAADVNSDAMNIKFTEMRRIRTESIFSEEAEDPKFGKRPSGNVTLKGDGVDLENSKDRTVTEADKSGNEKKRVLSEMEQHLADTQAGNKQRLDVLVYT